MATGSPTPTHPVVACASRLAAALDDVVAPDGAPVADPDYLPVDDRAALLVDLERVQTRVAALKARVLAGAQDVAEAEAAKDPGTWLAGATANNHARARQEFRLGRRLLRRPATARAFGSGAISPEHTAAVLDSVDRLPASVGAAVIDSIEATLIGYCADYTPRQVRRLGVHAFEVAAPEEADAILEKLLAAQEERARSKTRLSLSSRGDGTHAIGGVVPDLYAAVLAAALDAHTNPHRNAENTPGGLLTGDAEIDRLSFAQKRGLAFCELLEHLPVDGLPAAGGTPVEVAVVITEEKLRHKAGAAAFDDGLHLSAGATRRLLCSHGAYPVVLSGASTVLDQGRTKRLFTAGQVKAARLTQSTCRAAGCTVPSRWCHAHHEDPWHRGGATDLDRLVLLCPHHHQRVHDPTYDHATDARGRVRFTRIRPRT